MSGQQNHGLLFCFLIFIVLISGKCVKTNDICPSFDCGNGLNISYPFWVADQSKDAYESNCGYQELGVYCNGQLPTLISTPKDESYYVKDINYSQKSFTIVSYDFIGNKSITCPSPRHNFTYLLDSMGDLYDHKSLVKAIKQVDVVISTVGSFQLLDQVMLIGAIEEAGNVKAPFRGFALGLHLCWAGPGDDIDYTRILQEGFILNWESASSYYQCNYCEISGGFCSTRSEYSEASCICSDGGGLYYSSSDCYSVSGTSSTSKRKKILIGILVPFTTVTLVILVLLSIYRKKLLLCNKNMGKTPKVEMFLENYGSQGPRRYRFSDIKKMTNSFKDKLGQGGFGGVFKGKLLDGHLVAVKLLNEPKGEGEDFINEVATISWTNHINVVSLVGFCFEGSKRALIYEFMPNGSLEKFIYAKKQGMIHSLGWEKLYQIALGIARGLEYLHLGCNTRILHFDIKPHNILLDQDFCPKISDFGLAKLCPTRDSIVSMDGARGTTGYIAPEVYCRNFGGVSYKSDVYSYGMMILEIVGGRKNIDVTVENISEIYFPQWIYKKLQQEDEGLRGFEEIVEDEMARKMVLVGLWCIQTDPAMRPSMSRVLEMLEGNIEDLQVPPSPFLNAT